MFILTSAEIKSKFIDISLKMTKPRFYESPDLRTPSGPVPYVKWRFHCNTEFKIFVQVCTLGVVLPNLDYPDCPP